MKTKTHVILVKHSSPEIVENIPARRWNLSDEGKIRAQKLADKLVKYHPDVIFSSDEPKAQQTDDIIGG
jgi:broad specificity phosphatase PhoE